MDAHALSRCRRWLANGLIAAVAGASLLVIVLGKELWPFSHYPMYSQRREPGPITSYQLAGLTASGQEEVSAEQLFPFSRYRCDCLFRQLLACGEESRARSALLNFLERYERRRRAGQHAGAPLQALRLYRLKYLIDFGATTQRPPTVRQLVLEVRLEVGP